MTPAELDALCVVMRRHRVIRCGDVVLHPMAFAPEGTPDSPSPSLEDGPSAEELLFASSPFPMTPDELRAKPPEQP